MVKKENISIDEETKELEHVIVGIDRYPKWVERFKKIKDDIRKWKQIERRNQEHEIENGLEEYFNSK